MSYTDFLRLLPDLPTIAELFPGCICCSGSQQFYRGLRIYSGQEILEENRLYLIRMGDGFPVDTYAWISTDPISGSADHILCTGFSREKVLDAIMMLYSELQEQEHRLDNILYRSGGLDELCELGSQLLGNPVCIHDDWFIMIGKSSRVDEILTPEYIMSSQKGFLPRAIIDDFQDDTEYLETYASRTAALWDSGNGLPSIYANLWEGSIYRGRLIVIEADRKFRHRDFRLAEVIAQAVLLLIRSKQLGEHHTRSMDDIMSDLLHGIQPEASDQAMLLSMLKWNKQDQLLCVRIQSQKPEVSLISAHTLHNDLFRSFSGNYIMMTDNQQCLILNLSQDVSLRSNLRQLLAPICRDYCLYAGISSPISSIRDLGIAYLQAEVALNQAFQMRNEKWTIPFSECVLDYLINNVPTPLQPWNLVSPELLELIAYDQKNGTPYFETLRAYLLLERDIPRTSEALIIHRTTLLYRLKKISSLISVNWTDPQERLYLMLSLHILEQEQQR